MRFFNPNTWLKGIYVAKFKITSSDLSTFIAIEVPVIDWACPFEDNEHERIRELEKVREKQSLTRRNNNERKE